MPRSDFSPSLGRYREQVDAAVDQMAAHDLVRRLWARDHTLWKPEPTEIDNRLGWLTVAEDMRKEVPDLVHFARTIRDDGVRDVVLLGMGGSSLGPEVLRQTFGSARGFPRLTVLDTTLPGVVRAATGKIQPTKTLFIVASKSGGTIEVMSLFAHFWRVVNRARGNTGGQQFIAITDPNTSLGDLARAHGFRRTFFNPSEIGGRYSVLSYFGLVPAALMGLDIGKLLDRAITMMHTCRAPDLRRNTGAHLGTIMGVLTRAGRDKITLVASPQVASFGLWAEQLLAESTGKEGTGLIPVAGEPYLPVRAYGDDRLFLVLRLDKDDNTRLDRYVSTLIENGHPIVHLRLRDRYDVGGEFFRWEFATAVASSHLGIHPFDQPNVQESKDNTKRILARYQREGALPADRHDDVATLLEDVPRDAYLAILAYVPPSRSIDAALSHLRKTIATRHRVATTAGYGPRYLHSTGQLHKGGRAAGLFLELVDRMTPDLAIPDAPYTFGTLAKAQAIGDIESLQRHGRRAAFVVLGRDPARDIRALLTRRRPAPRQARARRRSRTSSESR